MRLWYFLFLLPLLLNCPKQIVPKVKEIKVMYLSSLYEDIKKEEPLLAGIKQLEGIKIGHLLTDPPFMEILLARQGFYELLNETGLDFIIGDTLLARTGDINYFFIPKSMGYAIDNYKGIRFAILSKDKDSLTIDDEIKLSLIKQRSDILWVIGKTFFDAPPMKIDFHLKNRQLSDTSITSINVKIENTLLEKLYDFKNNLCEILSQKIYLENKRLDDYVLSQIAENQGVNLILYPKNLFHDLITEDSITVNELINNVSCDFKFTVTKMTKGEAKEFCIKKGYQLWGGLLKNNLVMLPAGDVKDDSGKYLFDFLYIKE